MDYSCISRSSTYPGTGRYTPGAKKQSWETHAPSDGFGDQIFVVVEPQMGNKILVILLCNVVLTKNYCPFFAGRNKRKNPDEHRKRDPPATTNVLKVTNLLRHFRVQLRRITYTILGSVKTTQVQSSSSYA